LPGFFTPVRFAVSGGGYALPDLQNHDFVGPCKRSAAGQCRAALCLPTWQEALRSPGFLFLLAFLHLPQKRPKKPPPHRR